MCVYVCVCVCVLYSHVLLKRAVSPVASSCAPPLCRPLTGLGVHERSAYQLIPEFRGARAQWNFTDHLVKPNGFKAPPQLPYISLTHRWPVCGSIEAGEEHSHQGVNGQSIIKDIHFRLAVRLCECECLYIVYV